MNYLCRRVANWMNIMADYLKQTRQLIQKLKPTLVSQYHIGSIGLFGSIVRNDFKPDTSDVDIVVDFTQSVGIEFIDLAELLEEKLKRRVDVVSRKGVKEKYLKEIEKEIVYV